MYKTTIKQDKNGELNAVYYNENQYLIGFSKSTGHYSMDYNWCKQNLKRVDYDNKSVIDFLTFYSNYGNYIQFKLVKNLNINMNKKD